MGFGKLISRMRGGAHFEFAAGSSLVVGRFGSLGIGETPLLGWAFFFGSAVTATDLWPQINANAEGAEILLGCCCFGLREDFLDGGQGVGVGAEGGIDLRQDWVGCDLWRAFFWAGFVGRFVGWLDGESHFERNSCAAIGG